MLCLRKFPVAKKIMDKRGVLGFSVGKILSYGAEKFRSGTLLCFVLQNSDSEKDYG